MNGQADWRQVEDLFHSALELREPERETFLYTRCCDNEFLLNEVRALLAAYECEKNPLDEPVFHLGLAVIDEQDKEESFVGRTILGYKLLEKLGEGGMGTVYLAHDSRLDREVALKFVSSSYLDSDFLKKRLLREAQAAAKLDHPNICPIYAIEEVDGLAFIVMPRVSGKTLADLIKGGYWFNQQEVLKIVEQIAEAISAAHAQGIIHRDIKPANVMRDDGGHVEVLDFGLAKVINPSSHLSKSKRAIEDSTGLVFGTISYMSPEQLRNERLDFRTDIYSVGVLIYELCTLSNPFVRPNQADTISSVLNQTADLNRLDDSPCSSFKPIIQKCLEKDRTDRYSSMDELILALDTTNLTVGSRIRSRIISSSQWLLAALLMLLMAFGVGIYWRTKSISSHRVAVLPLLNNTGDPAFDYLGPGISEGLINRLARQASPSDLNIRPFTSVAGYGNQNLEPGSAARELDVDLLVNGTLQRENGRLIASFNAFDREHLGGVWTISETFETDDLLTLEHTVTEHVMATLQVSARSVNSPSVGGESGEAYRNYLIGQYYWSKRDAENIQKAILSFNRAIEIDPSYAKAYAGLANSFVLQSLVAYGTVPIEESMMKAKAAAKRAIEIDPENCEAHTALGVVLLKWDWNWRDAEIELRKSISKNPDYSPAHYWNASLMAITGRRDESIAEAKKARELDPFSPLCALNLARSYYYARQYNEAIQALQLEEGAGTNDSKIQYMKGLVLLQQQKYDEALPILQSIYAQNKLFGSAALGFCYGKRGERKKALAIISELQKGVQERSDPSLDIGIIYVGLNEKTKAVQFLERAYTERHSALISIRVEPLYDGVRNDPRFAGLLALMQLNDA